ncbi:MAG: ArsR family transcriptional regulator [Rhodobacteraceae bacterium]|uniref:ArsR/SmtB family transcription factor n=1 Tax=Cypionkella sp. TaxID=2811411 RepID=UPI00132CA004|nr:winged helix-turn-helix domain-containing protein [Cypionkella sp.]KAF0171472.1 MAG: ArsR family transcriptional regulator [Paracoccaceae bacterium]MDO8325380.1 winged helix-turn-helix domain-containing protein [Cypionkella sp.]
MEKAKALAALAALANDARLDLVRLLMPQGDQGLAAGEIGRALGLSASRLSFHLAALEQAGLIRSRKLARNVFYSVDAGGMGATIAFLLNDCCMEHPEVVACCRHGKPVTEPAIQTPEQPSVS